jgi:hypothetical protein
VPLYSNPGIDLESQAAGFDRFIPPFRLTDSTAAGANGFMLIGGDGEYEGFSHHYKVLFPIAKFCVTLSNCKLITLSEASVKFSIF